jgi:hypothetical protein
LNNYQFIFLSLKNAIMTTHRHTSEVPSVCPSGRTGGKAVQRGQRIALKTIFVLFLSLFSSFELLASHYKGGQITYQSLGGGTYKISIKSYWRSTLPGSVIPTYTGSPILNTGLSTASLTPLPDGVTVEKVEVQTVTWPQPGLYTVSWTSCCRVSGGANFAQNLDMGLFAAVKYDPAAPSSSPQFYDLPVFNYAANVPLSFGFNNSDPENHEQEYTLNVPYGVSGNPYTAMVASGFSIGNNGTVNWSNPQPGVWLVNVKLEEKINGVLTGAYVYRDFMLNIFTTTNHAPALTALAPQTVVEGQPLQFNVNATDPDGNLVTLRASGLPLTKGATFKQNGTGSSTNGTFTWTPGTGTIGSYTLQFVATDNTATPLSSQITVPVTVVSPAPPCNLSATASITNVPCVNNGNDGSISVAASGGTTYEYSIDGGLTYQNSNVFTSLAPGTYQVVAKEGACTSAAQAVTIVANPLPVISLNTLNAICINGGTVTLNGGLPAGGTYSGVGVNNGIFDPAVAGVGTHTIYYSYTNSNGCSNTSSTTITVNALPQVSLQNFGTVCLSAAPFLLDQGIPPGGSYTGTGVTNGYFYPAVAGAGVHTLTYSITNAAGCTVTASTDITVSPAITANAGPDKSVVYGYSSMACARLSASALGGAGNFTYRWSNGATGATINVCPTATTSYTVTATDAAGCSATDQVTVNVTNATCGNKNDKVLVCHNGHEICISENAVPAHLAHGDYLGSCDGNANRVGNNTAVNPLENGVTLTASPNPFNHSTIIDFTIPVSGSYTLDIYDLKGMLVKRIEAGVAEGKKVYSTEVDASNMPQGIYLARLVSAGQVKVTKLMLVK